MADEHMRAALAETAKWSRPAFYTAESDVFTGLAAGSTTRLYIEARVYTHVLVTGASLLRTLNPDNGSNPAPSFVYPAQMSFGNGSKDKLYNFNRLQPANAGAGLNTGFTWPDYIYLKPQERMFFDIVTTNANQMQFTLTCTCLEFLY